VLVEIHVSEHLLGVLDVGQQYVGTWSNKFRFIRPVNKFNQRTFQSNTSVGIGDSFFSDPAVERKKSDVNIQAGLTCDSYLSMNSFPTVTPAMCLVP
jgi:hypothetical protein